MEHLVNKTVNFVLTMGHIIHGLSYKWDISYLGHLVNGTYYIWNIL